MGLRWKGSCLVSASSIQCNRVYEGMNDEEGAPRQNITASSYEWLVAAGGFWRCAYLSTPATFDVSRSVTKSTTHKQAGEVTNGPSEYVLETPNETYFGTITWKYGQPGSTNAGEQLRDSFGDR